MLDEDISVLGFELTEFNIVEAPWYSDIYDCFEVEGFEAILRRFEGLQDSINIPLYFIIIICLQELRYQLPKDHSFSFKNHIFS